jgi:hypothetical protein
MDYTQPMTDEAIIMKHHPGVRPRARMSVMIVNQLIASAAAAGYTLREMEFEAENSGEKYDIKTLLFDLDEAVVLVYDRNDKEVGWVKLIFYNDGYDLISDYSVGLEDFLKACNELADKLANGLA